MATRSRRLIEDATTLADRVNTMPWGELARRAGELLPELAKCLREAEEELAEARTALDVPAGDICEAIEELQRLAAARRDLPKTQESPRGDEET